MFTRIPTLLGMDQFPLTNVFGLEGSLGQYQVIGGILGSQGSQRRLVLINFASPVFLA